MDEQQIRTELAAARGARFSSADINQKKKELYENYYRSINEERLLSVVCPPEEVELHIQNVLTATAEAEALEAEIIALVPGWSRPDGAILSIAPSFTPELAGIAKDRQRLLAEGMDTASEGGFFHFQNASDSESSTVSKIFRQKVSLSCDVSIPGKYKLEWYYEWARTGSSNNFEARVQKNDVDLVMEHVEETNNQDLRQISPICGFRTTDLTIGLHHFDLDYRNTGHGSAKVRNARLFLTKLM